MSRVLEEAWEKAHAAWKLACVVGVTVYRPNRFDGAADDIRVGVVTDVIHGVFLSYGDHRFVEKLGGEALTARAKFSKGLYPSGASYGDDYYSQTCDGHEFHLTRESAVKALVYYWHQSALEKRCEANELETRAGALEVAERARAP